MTSRMNTATQTRKWLCSAMASMLLVANASIVHADQSFDRGRCEAVSVIRELRKILTPNGVDRAELIRIGGIDQ